MKKTYVKMNDNDRYLSLGNLIRCIKEISNSDSALQSEIFCALFNTNNVNSTTINNYCIGIRAVGVEYKKIYMDLLNEYHKDKFIFNDIVISIINILDNKIYNKNDFNNNHNLKILCVKMLEIANNDKSVNVDYKNELKILLDNSNLYECIIKIIIYCVLYNKQPVFKEDFDIVLNNELKDYLKVKLFEGESYISSLICLSNENNMYALAELGSLEYSGLVSGVVRYDMSFEYYERAALLDHPKACSMIAHMILNNKVYKNTSVLWNYLNKAIDLGSVSAINTMGLCYLRGVNPSNKVDRVLAMKYFNMAANMGYKYAYNNIGMINEKDGNILEAIKYYKLSADMNESWALNKIGEYYRLKGDMSLAYFYYKLSNECPIDERCKWSKYNLDKYFSDKV